jgi:hypothetical protein
MDSEFTYQPQYIWKQTAMDGLLAVTNFTEEVKEENRKKGGKAKDASKQIGVISKFTADGVAQEIDDNDDEEVEAEAAGIEEGLNDVQRLAYSLANGSYIYLGNR